MELRVAAEKHFGDFKLDACFEISGDRIGVFGDSGSGKSTLVGLLAGLHEPDEGELYLDGDCLFSSKRINIPTEQRRIAIVFQQPSLFPHLSVKSNLLYGFKRCDPKLRAIHFDTLVEVLKLEELLGRGVNNLSGGEKQRVALGRAIMANPRLLLMDEPLSALDDALRFQIIPYLKSVSEQFRIPYLFISHSLVEMRLMAEQVLVVSGGCVVEQTTSDQLARNRMGQSPAGYTNLLKLGPSRRTNGLHAYPWGEGELLISTEKDFPEGIFELSSRDIILCKKHPEAISARNLLRCRVVNLFPIGGKVGVELDCGGDRLIAEVVGESARELEIREGLEIFAAVKASAFRFLG